MNDHNRICPRKHRWANARCPTRHANCAGATKVYAEKISGTVTDRKALTRAIESLGPGDTLIVTRLDRLARSTRDLLNILDTIARKGGKFRSLADAWCDTTTPHGELMVTILAGLATFERHLTRARTSDGRARAKLKGVRFGRKLKLTRFQIALARKAKGETLRDIAASYGVSHSLISRLPVGGSSNASLRHRDPNRP